MSDTQTISPAVAPGPRVHRIEVRPAPGQPDPVAEAVLHDLRQALPEVPVAGVGSARVYLVQATLSDPQVDKLARELLADPVAQTARVGIGDAPATGLTIEAHYLPGVMDPVAQSTREAMLEMFPDAPELAPPAAGVEVRTGFRYDIELAAGTDQGSDSAALASIRGWATKALANPVVQSIHDRPQHPERFPRAQPHAAELRHIPLRELDDDALNRLSREAHLFLSPEEMRAIRGYYRSADREPTDIELETLAQTWSEHCVHKTLKSTVTYRDATGDRSIFRGKTNHTLHPDGSVTIGNLLKSTVAAATHELMAEDQRIRAWCVSVFVDNAGVVRFDDTDAVCIKVETHNHPSAIEPYGGAATGIGGCIRDVMGTGLAARPIANTDVFCVAWAENRKQKTEDTREEEGDRSQKTCCDEERAGAAADATDDRSASVSGLLSSDFSSASSDFSLPRGVIHPRRILQQVVAGVRDYGNRMGIPTVNGAVCFDPDYLGNPLVFAGCVGLIPLDRCKGAARPGDRIIALGGRTGRDGIHGATFSSAELTDTHADEFAHAVQIGNAITQKKTLDVILQARDPHPHPGSSASADGRASENARGPLFTAITDCGAGGFSSAVGEMGKDIGARVDLEQAPLKYQGLSYTEVWISEAQERMVLAVPPENVEELGRLCRAEDVEMCDLGQFGWHEEGRPDEPILLLRFHGREVGRLSMRFLHDGIPTPVREAVWEPEPLGQPSKVEGRRSKVEGLKSNSEGRRSVKTLSDSRASTFDIPTFDSTLLRLLAHPDIASKRWIIRQYDHEVQGGSVIKPLVGPAQEGPSDAAVLRPKLDSERGIAIGCGLAPRLSEKARQRGWAVDGDSYHMTLHAIDEAIRNVVCVGAMPLGPLPPAGPPAGGSSPAPGSGEPPPAPPAGGSSPGSGSTEPDAVGPGLVVPEAGGIAILDNFCWPSCNDPRHLGTLVRAAEACYDGARAYRAPFVSGKDSLNNQFTTEDGRVIAIPPTLLITALGMVPDVRRCRSMDAKAPGNVLLLVGLTGPEMGGSHYVSLTGDTGFDLHIPKVDLAAGPSNALAVAELIAEGGVRSCHDCSEGGLLVAAAEMALAGGVGLDLDLEHVPSAWSLDERVAAFAESPSRYLLEVAPARVGAAVRSLQRRRVPFAQVGRFAEHHRLTVRASRLGRVADLSLDELRSAWTGTLDW